MAAGKNKTLRYTRMYVGPYDLSGDSRTFSALEYSTGEVPVNGWSEDANYLSDQVFVRSVTGYQAIVNDDTGRSFDALAGAPNDHVVTVAIGGGAAPAVSDLCYMLPAVQMSDQTALDGGVAVISADFMANAVNADANIRRPIGYVLLPLTALTATSTGTSVNNGAASLLGGYAHLHIFASDAGEWSCKVQHSANNVDWSDLITFAADGSVIVAEAKSASGTINQYTRSLLTRTSGTMTAAVFFARN